MKLKNLSSVILAAMMAATSVPAASLIAPYNSLSAYAVETAEPEAEAPIASGLCGENLTWEVFAEEDSLVIDGTGAMTEWENAEDAPWAEYGDRISLIVIRENVESISENAFGATRGRIFYFDGFDCVIPDSETFLPENASIHGYDNSTAHAYAEKYGREFTSEGEYEAPSDENISTDENVPTDENIPSDEEDSTVIEENRVVAEGMCGENLKWKIDNIDGALIISGYGEMTDWEKPEDAPWFEYSDEFGIVVIRPGVGKLSENSLGSNAKIIYLTSYNCVIPDSETFLPEYATIIGYDDSTAHVYAEKYGREFSSLGKSEGSAGEGNSSVVEGDGVIASGICGENLKWTIDSQDEVGLVVSGYGEMPDWESFDDTPWAEYCDSVGIIRVECGVQNVSENAFSGIDAFLFVVDNPNCVIPDSETAIPECAEIWGYDESTALAYAEKYGRECDSIGTADEYHVAEGDFNGLEWILWSNGDLAFYGYGDIAAENGVYPWDRVADSIKTITINTSVRSIGENAFTKCTSLESVLMYTPDCKIADSADVFPSDVLLQVGADTTAEEYASKYNLSHVIYNFFTASGEIGDNLSWTLFNGGSLRIYGEGDMIDLGGVNPWGEYEDEITRVQINEEVTSIDKSAFEGCDNIAEMIVLNPECKFAESEDAIPEDTVIFGAEGSGALMYAQMFGRSFKTISSEITAPEEEEESYIAYGELGENLTWELLNNGMLYINGEGEMLECGEGGYPWSDFSDKIKDISLAKEVTNIGAYAFYNCKNLETLHLAPVIGAHAYDGCINVNSVGYYSDIPVNEIGDYAFNNCGFFSYQFTNPDCVIADSEFVFPAGAIIEGYVGSTAQAHAEKYGLDFAIIEEEPVTTTAPDSDSETTTTTTTTTPNDSESELPQTGFSKAYDYLAFSAGVMALCGIYAMKKGKKKEDEE